FAMLNQDNDLKVIPLDNGTNIFTLELGKKIDGKKFRDKLRDAYNIRIAMPNAKNQVYLMVNETILNRDNSALVQAFKEAIKAGS
ncbi:MAG TPA: hypothetical protein PLG91_02955, partial [Ferruginibacter sp.]|nr:hypothetical protein [Ferruginibacter sp.]